MQQRTVDAPTPQVLEETVEVGRSVSHERVQQRAADQIEDAPQSPAEVVEAVRTVPRQLEVVAGGVSERHRLVTLGVCFRMFLELDPTLSSEKNIGNIVVFAKMSSSVRRPKQKIPKRFLNFAKICIGIMTHSSSLRKQTELRKEPSADSYRAGAKWTT